MDSTDKERIIKPNSTNVKRDFKFRIYYGNGANETIIPINAPTLDPNIPMFMNFVIKVGTVRQVNLEMVRYMDVDIIESPKLSI